MSRAVYLTIIFFLLPVLVYCQEKWLISESSSVCVNGSTNINRFACEIPAYGQKDTLAIADNGSKGLALSGTIKVKVQNFDCHNTMMTRDMRKTLKEPQFSLLAIKFLSLNKQPAFSAQPEQMAGQVEIVLAGVARRFDINYHASADKQKVIHLVGERNLNFTDFGLRPPTKLGGMIKTNDQLTVTFQLKITVLN